MPWAARQRRLEARYDKKEVANAPDRTATFYRMVLIVERACYCCRVESDIWRDSERVRERKKKSTSVTDTELDLYYLMLSFFYWQ